MAPRIKIADLFATIGADTKDLEKGLGTAKGSLTGFAGDFLKQALGIASATALITSAVKTVADSVSDWSAYNIEMDKGATATGMMAEEYSRLIQAADDARVSQEQMTTALEVATKNGYPMTIEGLGQIADQLKSIQDPSERAKKAMEIFGRGWSDIMPFLDKGSAGINKLTDAIDDNMIATEESIRKSQEYATQVDDLQDAWQGFKNELGAAVMPVLTEVLTSLVDQITEVKLLTANMDKFEEAVDNGTISQEEFANAALAARFSTEAGIYATDRFTESTSSLASMYAQSAEAMKTFAAEAINPMNRELDNLSNAYREQKDLIGKDLIEAYGRLQSATDSYRGGVAGSLAQGLRDAGIQGDELIQRLELVDKYAGTNYATEYKMELDLPDLLKTLIEDPTAFTNAAAAYDDAFLPLQEGVKAAQADIDAMKANLASLERSYFTHYYVITHSISTNQAEYNPPPAKSLPFYGPPAPGRAAGGPVYDGMPYLVGERGPELFVPESSGDIVPNGKNNGLGGNAELLNAISKLATAKDIGRAVRDAILMATG